MNKIFFKRTIPLDKFWFHEDVDGSIVEPEECPSLHKIVEKLQEGEMLCEIVDRIFFKTLQNEYYEKREPLLRAYSKNILKFNDKYKCDSANSFENFKLKIWYIDNNKYFLELKKESEPLDKYKNVTDLRTDICKIIQNEYEKDIFQLGEELKKQIKIYKNAFDVQHAELFYELCVKFYEKTYKNNNSF